MKKNVTMHARDAISASLAECVIVLGDNRYNFMQATELSAEFKKIKKKVAILGKPGGGNKTTGWEGSGKAKFHFNTSLFRKLMLDYALTGEDVYFDIIIKNEDPTSKVGSQTIILKDCNIDNMTLVKFNAGGDTLDEEFSFTFEDAEMPEMFDDLDGFVL